ncbi:MAG: CarD family transcriptional regulator [Acutalibacteraceae bacterium]
MYAINDTVLYGTDGVCTVTDIAKRRFGKTCEEYYILTPLHQDGAVIYVPTQNETLRAKMRRVLSADEIRSLIREMPDGDALPWESNELLRRQQFRQILQGGDRRELIRLIRTIYLHGQQQKENGRKLHHADEQIMRDAEALLYDEFSYVLHIGPQEVLPFILQEIG